jgi:uncharacterized repeat protein (TIGR04042 family)
MPEMRFFIRWPDGSPESCYSPSLVIKDHLSAGQSYSVRKFVELSRIALRLASDRVEAKFGMPCSRALGQLARIESAARAFEATPEALVLVEHFEDL